MINDDLIDKLNSLPIGKGAVILNSLKRSYSQLDSYSVKECVDTAAKKRDQIRENG